MFAEAIQSAIKANTGISERLALYEFTTGDPEPGIFTRFDAIPEDASLPAIIINALEGSAGEGTRAKREWDVAATVRVYDDKNQSLVNVRAIAWDIARLLARADLDQHLPAGFALVNLQCSSPGELADPDGFPGLVITVSGILQET